MTDASRAGVSDTQTEAPSTVNPGTTVVARAATTLSWRHRLTSSLALPVMSVMVLIVVLGSIKNPLFYSPDTWSNILRASSFIIIVACFEALVMIAGGIDLSVGASFLAGAMAAAYMVDSTGSIALAFAGALLVGLGIGLINGFLASWLMISPIIATLGTLFGVGAIVVTLSGGLAIGPLPRRLQPDRQHQSRTHPGRVRLRDRHRGWRARRPGVHGLGNPDPRHRRQP